ncbi:hypothetical protein SO694_00164028 [Aureococcus anophagefferens]|uniref:Uncharacterized protein n=1 Tax=Aureococcus anophagefferens TaxID=44056 RepID=A0ABR1G6A4_AURAN
MRLRDHDVVVASRAEKRPLVRCRGDLVYATDDDNVGAFEKYLTVKACRVDAYRVRRARWEPLHGEPRRPGALRRAAGDARERGLLAVAEADVTDYVWRDARGPGAPSSWSVVKLNAVLAPARGRRQGSRPGAAGAAEGRRGGRVVVRRRGRVGRGRRGPADQRGARAARAADPAFFGGGAFALDVTLAAPAVVVDRSGLAPGFLVFARSRDERAPRLAGRRAGGAPAPSAARVVAPCPAAPSAALLRPTQAAPARLAWVRDDAEDARFLRDPATTQILTVGGDASVVPGFRASHLVASASCDATPRRRFDARATCRPLWLMEGGFGRRPSAAGRRTARIFASDGAKAPVRFDLYEKDVAPGGVCKLRLPTTATRRATTATRSPDGASSYYEVGAEEEAAGDEFFDCVDDEARAPRARRGARAPPELRDALVVAGGGATFAGARRAPPPRAGAPVPFELGDKALCLAVSAGAAARVVAVLPRFVVLNALPCRLAVDGAAEVWRFTLARVAPLSFALDRATLVALCEAADAFGTVLAEGPPTTPGRARRRRRRRAAWRRRVAAARGAAAPADLFAALAREPRVYVDTIELGAVDLRCTLALAGAPRGAAATASTARSPLRARFVAHASGRRSSTSSGALGDLPRTVADADLAAATTALTAAAPRAAGAVSSALGDKLAGAHARDAAYFCDRARRHAARRRREGGIRSLAAGLQAARRGVADGATGR